MFNVLLELHTRKSMPMNHNLVQRFDVAPIDMVGHPSILGILAAVVAMITDEALLYFLQPEKHKTSVKRDPRKISRNKDNLHE